MSRPWMPLYVRDYLADTVHLSTLEQGSYLLLILYYWLHEGLPTDDAKLARIVRLPSDQWMEIRPTIAEFFEPDWRHKRIETELAVANEKYQKRAEAGRQGGRVSGQTRQKRTNAEAMLKCDVSNAEAGLNQPQPQPLSQKEESQSGAHALTGTSEEDRFWAHLNDLGKGISRALCAQLPKLYGGDFLAANRALDHIERANNPGAYLGKIVRNLQQDGQATSMSGANPHVPAFVEAMRVAGVPIEREGNHWRCQGRLWTDDGEEVG